MLVFKTNVILKLKFVVFISGACVMMIEMIGSRILAPFVGTSIYIWTSLIGIILTSLSLGYWWGGKLADHNPKIELISLILAVAALATGTLAAFNQLILTILSRQTIDLRIIAVIAALILFSPVSILLGMISPYVAKLCLSDTQKTGKVIGSLSALSSLGSIVGTFLSGFLLISFIGSTNLLFIIAGILLLTAIYLNGGNHLNLKFLTAIFLGYFYISKQYLTVNLHQQQIIDRDTQYSRVWIYPNLDFKQNKIKLMMINNESSSAMYLDSDELVFEYTKAYQLAEFFNPGFKNTLLIGGAGYSYPKYYLNAYPDARIDVVEIDTGITQLAIDYFNLKPNPRLNIIHQDGRVYINHASQKYDVILGDAFKSHTVPFQLTTVEAVSRMSQLLNENGVVLINLAGAINGDKGEFPRASYHTYAQVFPQVYLFQINPELPADQLQNIMLVAIKSDQKPNWISTNPIFKQFLSGRWIKPIIQDVKILTDDFAPVEYYSRNII